ncbi:hypothetical protein [Niabella hibiscisoli]|uniref:hypothetical protein n=1 Tax=Niabella hibiscisoli TaxID=1825928 RepID=UPI001F0E2450|nr:hypothetical protein [Niabella hibiscisoli]MCH5720965.1 hypothetical protein [Niabella hibiscisoli]
MDKHFKLRGLHYQRTLHLLEEMILSVCLHKKITYAILQKYETNVAANNQARRAGIITEKHVRRYVKIPKARLAVRSGMIFYIIGVA